MKITLDLTTDEAIALRRFANEFGPLPLEDAAALAVREYLISVGMLEPQHELSEGETDV